MPDEDLKLESEVVLKVSDSGDERLLPSVNHIENCSDSELRNLAMHPGTPESVWLPACDKLNQSGRTAEKKAKSTHTSKVSSVGKIVLALTIAGCIGFAGFTVINNEHAPSASTTAAPASQIVDPMKAAEFSKYMKLGLANYDAGKYQQAISDFTLAMQLDPSRPGPLNNRALCYRTMGDKQSALEDCNLLISRFPDYSHGWAQRAHVYSDIGQNEHAAQDMSKAIELDPTRPGYYVGRQAIYTKLGNADYRKAAEVDPKYFKR